jgi:hypothetical protein
MTPSIIIAVLIATGIWATVASIIAHTRGRDYHLMAERHNSVVNALRKTEVEFETVKCELKLAREEAEHHYLKGLQKIDQLTTDKEELTRTCDDLFDTLVDAVAKMPVPLHLRQRDESGRFAKNSPFDIATNMLIEKQVKMERFDFCKGKTQRLCNEVRANAVTDIAPKLQVYRSKVLNIGFDATKGFDVVTHDEAYSPCEVPNEPYVQRSINRGDRYCYTTKRPERKPHTLKHGMTVKNPTTEEAKEIFAEARRLGIIAPYSGSDRLNSNYPDIWYSTIGNVSRCVVDEGRRALSITPQEFIARMRGE